MLLVNINFILKLHETKLSTFHLQYKALFNAGNRDKFMLTNYFNYSIMVTTKATFLRLWLDMFQTKLLLTSLIALFLFLSIRTNSRQENIFSFQPVAGGVTLPVNHGETLGRGE